MVRGMPAFFCAFLFVLFSALIGCSSKKEEKPIPDIPPGGLKNFTSKPIHAPKVQIPVQ